MFRVPIRTTQSNVVPLGFRSDWLALPEIPEGEEGINVLLAVDSVPRSLRIRASGNYIVDWGDGTPLEFVNSYNYSTIHYYLLDELPIESTMNNGSRQCIVKVYPQNGATMSSIELLNDGVESDLCVIDMFIRGVNLTSITMGSNGPTPDCYYLQRIRFKGTNKIISYASMYHDMSSLIHLDWDDFSSGKIFNGAFQGVPLSVMPENIVEALNINDVKSLYRYSGITEIPALDLSKATSFYYLTSQGSPRLRRFKAINIATYNLTIGINVLPVSDIEHIIDQLMDATALSTPPVLSLYGSKNIGELSQEKIDQGLAKGWTITT